MKKSEKTNSIEQKAIKRAQILEAAVKAFSRHGYHSCTMNRVAKEAGVADGTLYLYVKGKEDLLVTAFSHVLGLLMERLDKEIKKLDNPVSKLRRLMELHFEVMENDPDLAGFLQFQLRQPDPAIRAAIRTPLVQYANRIEAIVEEGKEKGTFRKSIGTRAMRRVIFGSMDETVSAWWFRQDGNELMKKVAPLMEVILHGLLINDDKSRKSEH